LKKSVSSQQEVSRDKIKTMAKDFVKLYGEKKALIFQRLVEIELEEKYLSKAGDMQTELIEKYPICSKVTGNKN